MFLHFYIKSHIHGCIFLYYFFFIEPKICQVRKQGENKCQKMVENSHVSVPGEIIGGWVDHQWMKPLEVDGDLYMVPGLYLIAFGDYVSEVPCVHCCRDVCRMSRILNLSACLFAVSSFSSVPCVSSQCSLIKFRAFWLNSECQLSPHKQRLLRKWKQVGKWDEQREEGWGKWG